MMRCAGCDEMIFEVVSVDFGWMLLILGSCARTSHTPGPSLGRGDFGCCVFVGNEWFECIYFPSREGRFEMLFSY